MKLATDGQLWSCCRPPDDASAALLSATVTKRTALPNQSRVALVGEGATEIAPFHKVLDDLPIAVDGGAFVLLADAPIDGSPSRLRDLEPESVDVVALHRAWETPAEVPGAIAAAYRVLAPGGLILVSDLDADRLLTGSVLHYPIRLLIDGAGLANTLRSRVVSGAVLAMETTRGGFGEVWHDTVDNERSRHASAEEYWTAVSEGSWLGSRWVDADDREPLLEVFSDGLSDAYPMGPVVDREPWVVVEGFKR